MNYSKKSFSVGAGSSQEYRDRWEQTFRGEKAVPECTCGASDAVIESGGMHAKHDESCPKAQKKP